MKLLNELKLTVKEISILKSSGYNNEILIPSTSMLGLHGEG